MEKLKWRNILCILGLHHWHWMNVWTYDPDGPAPRTRYCIHCNVYSVRQE